MCVRVYWNKTFKNDSINHSYSYKHPHTSSETLTSSLPHWLVWWNKALPPSIDEPNVLSRADILQNKSFITSGQVNVGQVGFTHIQPVGGVLTSGQLKNVSYQCCHTQAKDMDTCEKQIHFTTAATGLVEHVTGIHKYSDMDMHYSYVTVTAVVICLFLLFCMLIITCEFNACVLPPMKRTALRM